MNYFTVILWLDKYQQFELSLISKKVANFISIKISVCDLCHNIIFSTLSKLIVNCLYTERFCVGRNQVYI